MPLSSSVDNIYGGSTWHGNDITGLGYQTIAGNCIEYKPPLFHICILIIEWTCYPAWLNIVHVHIILM